MNLRSNLTTIISLLIVVTAQLHGQNLEPLTEGDVYYQYELTKTAFCSNGSDRALNGTPRFDGPMEAKGITYKNFQYVSYYEADGSIIVARRNLAIPSVWEKSVIQGHKMLLHDRHRKISIGISSGDGVIHVSFDHHNDKTFNYAHSTLNAANNPKETAWNDQLFTYLPNLGMVEKTEEVTYPEFSSLTESGDLIINWRTGGDDQGEMNLAHYNSRTNKWSFIGMISSRQGTYNGTSGTRGPYNSGFYSDTTGTLHVAWLWREDAGAQGYKYRNHGIYYAMSKDGGFSWNDTNDKLIADSRKNETISVDNIGDPIFDIPMSLEPSNSNHYAAIDPLTNYYHYFNTHYKPGTTTNKAYHYVRKTNGEWTEELTTIKPGEGKIYFADNCAFLVTGPYIYYSKRESGFKTWVKLNTNKTFEPGQGNWDAGRLNQGILSFYLHKNPNSLGSPSPVVVYDIKVAEASIPNDIDGDLIADDIDNCTDTFNPYQEDADNDGIGDACDQLTTEIDSEKTNTPKITISPNPVSNVLRFNTKAKWALYDLSGQKLLNGWSNNINLSTFDAGVYIVKISGVTHKIIKQ